MTTTFETGILTPEQCREFRRGLADCVLAMQLVAQEHGMPADVFVPEMIAALMSLAAFMSAVNGSLTREQFIAAMQVAADERWPRS